MMTRPWICALTLVFSSVLASPVLAQQAGTPHPASSLARLEGLNPVSSAAWDETAVRNVLQVFAFGGHASERTIANWARMSPDKAVRQMLTFEPVNRKLSSPGRGILSAPPCASLVEMQELWASNDPGNPARVFDRPYYAPFQDEQTQLNPLGTYLAWSRAMHTRGCNLFLHKMAFYLTNYHAAIHLQNAGTALIRDYYDDMVAALVARKDFVELMYQAASNGALAQAYGHSLNYVDPADGVFHGNDDFAREYFQLLFSIDGIMEGEEYHEGVSIENNARLLTGMFLDLQPDRFGSTSQFDWLLSEIDFSDHVDAAGREIYNRSAHFDFRKESDSCLEILHQQICGRTADEKLRTLGPVAAAHPESMANTPLKIIRFFADSAITPDESEALRLAWADADYDLLRFIRAYAISTRFHSPDRFKYLSAFERNLQISNATVLDNEESFARPFFSGPVVRMFDQGALVFSPVRDVFGGQTGNDAANDRFLFKNAWGANVNDLDVLGAWQEYYFLDAEGEALLWQKDWSSVIPPNAEGKYLVGEVAEWLWQRYIADNGKEFDAVARANVHSLLATGFDFAAMVDDTQLDAIYSSADILDGPVAAVNQALAETEMHFFGEEDQERVGMAVNFITMMPYTFGQGGHGQ